MQAQRAPDRAIEVHVAPFPRNLPMVEVILLGSEDYPAPFGAETMVTPLKVIAAILETMFHIVPVPVLWDCANASTNTTSTLDPVLRPLCAVCHLICLVGRAGGRAGGPGV